MSKTAVSFTLPKALKKEMREHFIKRGYGLRRKSEWVERMINRLLDVEDFEDLINNNVITPGNLDLTDTIKIDMSLYRRIEKSVELVRRKYPLLEGVQSKIIRTAIIQGIEILDYAEEQKKAQNL